MAEEQDLKEAPRWPTLKVLEPGTKEFTANGRTYRVYHTVSFDRYEAYELLQVEVGLARTYQQFMDELRAAYDLCNEVATGKKVFADLAVLLRDMIVGTTLVGERQIHPVLRMCALFINREGEDLRYIDEGLIESKVNDWKAEGIDMGYFFAFALRSIPGFIEAYKAVSRDTSDKERERAERRAAGSTSKPASSGSKTATTAGSQLSAMDG